jgi:hypothetical protein
MKRSNFKSISASSFLICAIAIGGWTFALPALPQTTSDSFQITIPFSFQTGRQHMPAGHYEIESLSPQVILLRELGQHRSDMLIVYPADGSRDSARGSVVFSRFGDKYFLHQVWAPGARTGQECARSRAEKELMRADSSHASTPVTLALNATSQR